MESYVSATQESFLFAIWNNLEALLLSRQSKGTGLWEYYATYLLFY